MEYYFIPDSNTSGSDETDITAEYMYLLNSLPAEIKENLPNDFFSGDINDITAVAESVTDFSVIKNKLIKFLINALVPALKDAAILIGFVFLSSLSNLLTSSLSDRKNGKFTSLAVNTGISLAIIGRETTALHTTENLKTVICGLMNGMVPLIGAFYAVSGNPGTAAIQSGGILALVTLCQSIFSNVLMPAVRICLVLSIVGSVFSELNIKPITNVFKNITTAIIIAAVSLFTFILGLQNSIAQSTDSLGYKSIKFAIGNLIPIVGGTLSDSLDTIGASLSAIKSAGGSVVIIMVILLIAPTIVSLIAHRFVLFICKNIAGMLNSKNAETILGELGSITSILLAFSGAISASFIYALMLFTKSTLAINS